MSEPEPEIIVPPGLEGGVFANHVDLFEDIEYVTLDFAFLDPRDARIGFRCGSRPRAELRHNRVGTATGAFPMKEFPKYSFFTRYRSKRIELSPENKERLRQRLERADAYRRAKFPEYYRGKD